MHCRRSSLSLASGLFAFAALLLWPALAAAAPLTVFAAASLTDALNDAGKAWAAEGHEAPRFSYGASSTLAQQIAAGAPADLFISADEKWMDWAAGKKLINSSTRATLLSNTLVLVAPKADAHAVTIDSKLDIAKLLGPNGRIATGNPAHVPVGLYAKAALEKLGLWAAVKPRLASAENVRAALLLVQRAEAPYGIVYATDAAMASGVSVVGTFPQDSYPRIAYPFAVTASSTNKDAEAFLKFLQGPQATAVFKARGFIVLSH
jgi:molybdate transport system substrate-binding protein